MKLAVNFQQVYQSYADRIYRYLRSRTNDPELAEDLTSEVFTKAWKAWPAFDGKYTGAWLFRIAHNTLADNWRKKHEIALTPELCDEIVDESNLEDMVDAKKSAEDLSAAIASLPVRERQVITLRYLKGLPVKTISRLTSLSAANVRVIQYRAIQHLKGWYLVRVFKIEARTNKSYFRQKIKTLR